MHTSAFFLLFSILVAQPGAAAGDSEPDVDKPLSSGGFSWVIDGQLAAMPLPGAARSLEEDVDFLGAQGITVLVSLTEDPPSAEALKAAGISGLHLPVPDFTAPSLEQLLRFTEEVDRSRAMARPVGVHCTAGLGRSGTFVAAYFVSQGASASEAIAKVRVLRPGSVETEAQELRIAEFERFLAREVLDE